MPDVDRIAIAAEVRRQLDLLPPPRGPRGLPGLDAEIDPEMVRDFVRAELEQAVAALPKPKDGEPGPRGKDAFPPQAGPCVPVPPMFPQRAEFLRDPDTHRTLRMIVSFPPGDLFIDPVYDEDGFIVAADFEPA